MELQEKTRWVKFKMGKNDDGLSEGLAYRTKDGADFEVFNYLREKWEKSSYPESVRRYYASNYIEDRDNAWIYFTPKGAECGHIEGVEYRTRNGEDFFYEYEDEWHPSAYSEEIKTWLHSQKDVRSDDWVKFTVKTIRYRTKDGEYFEWFNSFIGSWIDNSGCTTTGTNEELRKFYKERVLKLHEKDKEDESESAEWLYFTPPPNSGDISGIQYRTKNGKDFHYGHSNGTWWESNFPEQILAYYEKNKESILKANGCKVVEEGVGETGWIYFLCWSNTFGQRSLFRIREDASGLQSVSIGGDWFDYRVDNDYKNVINQFFRLKYVQGYATLQQMNEKDSIYITS